MSGDEGGFVRDLWRPTGYRHGALGSIPDVINDLRVLWGAQIGDLRDPYHETDLITLEVNDTEIAGQAFEARCSIRRNGETVEGECRATIEPDGHANLRRDVAVEPDDHGFSVAIPGLRPGAHLLEVTAQRNGVSVPPCREWITVVEA